jgi:ABC-type Mn2+/Zn2+ transport system ATPase subunit
MPVGTHISSLHLKRFTAFEAVTFNFSSGINILVGKNGTGKTHVLKLLYSILSAGREDKRVSDKLAAVFLPFKRSLGRLVKRTQGLSRCSVRVTRGEKSYSLTISTKMKGSARVSDPKPWGGERGNAIFIPVKEMLANAPQFVSLYQNREIHFEEVYSDIINKALLPNLRGPVDKRRRKLLTIIEKAIDGKVEEKNQEFFLRNGQGNLEFTLLAEGMRKLALIWRLIQNGSLSEGSTLFWDEPEANINPGFFGTIAEILLELQRGGVQIFVATHSYLLAKEIENKQEKNDKILYHSIFKGTENHELMVSTESSISLLEPNALAEIYDEFIVRDAEKALNELKNEKSDN